MLKAGLLQPMATQSERAERFKALHEREDAFVIPNPWDAGSARLLAGLGFEALADAGVKRISIGGAPARAALTALLRAGIEMRDEGSFGWTSDLATSADVHKLLSA